MALSESDLRQIAAELKGSQTFAVVDPSPRSTLAGAMSYGTVNEALAMGHTWIRLADGAHQPFTVSKESVVIEGTKGAIVDGGSGSHAVTIESSASKTTLRGFTVKTTQGGGSYDGINAIGSYIRILDLDVLSSGRFGMYIRGGDFIHIRGCFVTACTSTGFALDGTAGGQMSYPLISSCHSLSNGGYGVYFDKVNLGSMTGCSLVNNSSGGLTIGYTSYCQGITATGNFFYANGAQNVQIYQTGSAGHHNISGNTYDGRFTNLTDSSTAGSNEPM